MRLHGKTHPLHMKTTTMNCLGCQKTFEAPTREVKRGNGKFCSRDCFKSSGGLQDAAKKAADLVRTAEVAVVCAYCGATSYRKPARQRSKSNTYFCSRVCKDHGQRIENGITAIHPSHYGTENGVRYRKLALSEKGSICERCGYNKCLSALQVHHLDKNRSNNRLENLMVLCANCHCEVHHQDRQTGS